MNRWGIAFLSVVALVVLADVATAQPPGGQQRPAEQRPGPPFGPEGRGPGRGLRLPQIPLMLALDADKDGEISADEIENAVAALKKLDNDGNGKLTRDELRPRSCLCFAENFHSFVSFWKSR